MKALIFEGKDIPLRFGDWENPIPRDGEVLVRLEAAALNHRDVFITQGLYPRVRVPVVLGSDGAGWAGERAVVINPSLNWGSDPKAQGSGYEILGMPRNGTFAERVVVPSASAFDKPLHLNWEQAAALPLAGLTAYRALFPQGRIEKNQKVLITGVGGGVALWAVQFSLAAGAEVWVSSGSEEKIERALELGVAGGVNYHLTDWHKQLLARAGEFDLIVDGAGGEGLGFLLRLAKAGGRMVVYGGSKGIVPNFSPQILFWKQLTVIGSTAGSDSDFSNMLDFINRHRICPVLDEVFPLQEGGLAFERMAKGLQFGKIILKFQP